MSDENENTVKSYITSLTQEEVAPSTPLSLTETLRRLSSQRDVIDAGFMTAVAILGDDVAEALEFSEGTDDGAYFINNDRMKEQAYRALVQIRCARIAGYNGASLIADADAALVVATLSAIVKTSKQGFDLSAIGLYKRVV